MQAAFDAEKAPLDLLLDAQRRLADAQSRYFRAMTEHAVAVKNVHFAKGTLLDYDGVYLSEGGWPLQAQQDAARRESHRGQPVPLNYASSSAPRVSYGRYDQRPDRMLPVEFDASGPVVTQQARGEQALIEPVARPTADGPTTKVSEEKPASSAWTPEVPSVPIRTLSAAGNVSKLQAMLGTAHDQGPMIDSAVQPASHNSTALISLPVPLEED